MKIGVTFPQTEIGSDPIVLRDYAQAAESLGYHHLLAYDHVIGADVSGRPNWRGYTHESQFHEPLVLFAYLGALTTTIEFVSGVVILPQRQTVLFAKQAAEVDVLTGGRLRLAVGLGWNAVEYEALNEDFHTRGRRISEQIQVLRLLWTQAIVDFKGRWHRIDRAGINPLPVQRPIPVWMGGAAEAAIRRIARVADGWIPFIRPGDDAAKRIEGFRAAVREAGRDPSRVGIQAGINIEGGGPEDWRQQLREWQALGVTHSTVGALRGDVGDQIARLRALREAVGELAT